MNTSSIKCSFVVVAFLCCGLSGCAHKSRQKTFATPEDAAVALVDAAKAGNAGGLLEIFGPEVEKLVSSGDSVMDQQTREVFLVAYSERAALMAVSPDRSILYIGNEDWPFPIPLVKEGEAWRFDTAAGAQETLFRRIGSNELNTIRVCRTYVEAQNEYAAEGHDGNPAGSYARKLASSPGKHDGLYWQSEDADELSPLGEFAAEAASQGYGGSADQATPFHGYFFRILNSQGFPLIAFPAAYGVSGVMTFMVNQDGVVYQKDLGVETAKRAAEFKQFEPVAGWEKVV